MPLFSKSSEGKDQYGVASNIPSQGTSREHDSLSPLFMNWRRPTLRMSWRKGPRSFKCLPCAYKTTPENDSDLYFSMAKTNQPCHFSVDWGIMLVQGSTMKNEQATVTSGTQWKPGLTLPMRDVLHTDGQQPDWQRLPVSTQYLFCSNFLVAGPFQFYLEW